ncbi:MAG: diphthine--ammonia ligase [Bacilli bacterium]
MLKNKKFIMSWSGGKDSTLALHRALQMGGECTSLFTTVDETAERSWFHGLSYPLLEAVAKSLNLPLTLCPSNGTNYTQQFESFLQRFKKEGVTHCVFGDIDLEEHRTWCTERCENVGMQAVFPLWQENRESLVQEVLSLGYKPLIKIVDTNRIKGDIIGRTLTWEIACAIEAEGADMCGEEGEFHTFVYDGPQFQHPVSFEFGQTVQREQYILLDIHLR